MTYTYDRTAAGSSSALQTVRTHKTSVEASEKAISKAISTIARMPGMSAVTGALDSAADSLKEAAKSLGQAEDRLIDITNNR